MYRSANSGFTLIELLVVISIIGFLSSIGLASFDVARARARDIQRVQAINQIRNALEAYKSDFGQYPQVDSAANGSSSSCLTTFSGGGAPLNSSQALGVLVPKYIPQIPSDPINNGSSCYYYISNNADYYNYISCEGTKTEYSLSFKPEKTLSLPKMWLNGSPFNPPRYCVAIY